MRPAHRERERERREVDILHEKSIFLESNWIELMTQRIVWLRKIPPKPLDMCGVCRVCVEFHGNAINNKIKWIDMNVSAWKCTRRRRASDAIELFISFSSSLSSPLPALLYFFVGIEVIEIPFVSTSFTHSENTHVRMSSTIAFLRGECSAS